METFKRILHHPNYMISNYGRVINDVTGQILKPTTHIRKGRKIVTTYLRIELKNPTKKYLVHRLVAEAFIDNPELHDLINHKDKNGSNNDVSNLEWCDNIYNCTYSQGVPVNQRTLKGAFIERFKSISEAARKTGSDFRLISAVCRRKRKTHNKYKWEYAIN